MSGGGKTERERERRERERKRERETAVTKDLLFYSYNLYCIQSTCTQCTKMMIIMTMWLHRCPTPKLFVKTENEAYVCETNGDTLFAYIHCTCALYTCTHTVCPYQLCVRSSVTGGQLKRI